MIRTSRWKIPRGDIAQANTTSSRFQARAISSAPDGRVVVVADNEEICDRALRLIEIKWEEQPFILDMKESLKPDAPKIMPEVLRLNSQAKGPNTLVTKTTELGDVQKGFAEADKIIEYTLTRATNTPAGVEAMACVVQWRGDCLDIWPHHTAHMRPILASAIAPSVPINNIALGYGTASIEVNLHQRTGHSRFQPSPNIARLL